jgi:hypothetical protein
MNVQKIWQHLMPQQHSYETAQARQLCKIISEHTAYIILDGTLLTAYQLQTDMSKSPAAYLLS